MSPQKYVKQESTVIKVCISILTSLRYLSLDYCLIFLRLSCSCINGTNDTDLMVELGGLDQGMYSKHYVKVGTQ